MKKNLFRNELGVSNCKYYASVLASCIMSSVNVTDEFYFCIVWKKHSQIAKKTKQNFYIYKTKSIYGSRSRHGFYLCWMIRTVKGDWREV